MTASRQLRRARLAASAFALGLGLGALPGWAQGSAADFVEFAGAEAEIHQLEARADEAMKADPTQWPTPLVEALQIWRIASAWQADHPAEVAQDVATWKPALSAAWQTCRKHSRVVEKDFEPLFQSACPGVEKEYGQAREVVGYVLSKRAAATDLAIVTRTLPR